MTENNTYIGANRTHIGSAHGRGISPPAIQVSEARLAVNASHTLVSSLWNAGMPVKRQSLRLVATYGCR